MICTKRRTQVQNANETGTWWHAMKTFTAQIRATFRITLKTIILPIAVKKPFGNACSMVVTGFTEKVSRKYLLPNYFCYHFLRSTLILVHKDWICSVSGKIYNEHILETYAIMRKKLQSYCRNPVSRYHFIGYKIESSCAFRNLHFLNSYYWGLSEALCAKYFSNAKLNVAGLGMNLGGKIPCVKAKNPVLLKTL